MDKIIYSLAVILLCISCNSINEKDNLQQIGLNDVLELIPISVLENNSEVVFVNSASIDKTLDLEFYKGTKQVNDGSILYVTDFISVLYSDNHDNNLRMKVELEPYFDNGRLIKNVVVTLLANSSNPIPILSLSPQGSLLNTHYIEITLNGRSFENVYSNILNETQENKTYSEIYYSLEIGVVGYRDFEGELWAFKEFKN